MSRSPPIKVGLLLLPNDHYQREEVASALKDRLIQCCPPFIQIMTSGLNQQPLAMIILWWITSYGPEPSDEPKLRELMDDIMRQ